MCLCSQVRNAYDEIFQMAPYKIYVIANKVSTLDYPV